MENGLIVLGSTSSLTLSNVSAQPGDSITCTATVSDGYGATDDDSYQVTVENSLPVVDSISLTPANPTVAETFTCSANASDIDGDTPALAFAFSNQTSGANHTSTTTGATTATLELATTDAAPDDIFACTVTATDANGGSSSDSTTSTLVNTAPVFTTAAEITPTSGIYRTTLGCSAVASDLEDGPHHRIPESRTAPLGSGNSYTVSSTETNVGDAITCEASATDSYGQHSLPLPPVWCREHPTSHFMTAISPNTVCTIRS